MINKVFPIKNGESERQRKNREDIVETIHVLFGSKKNAASYGENGWSTYNAIVEYLDHYRPASLDERALTSMDDLSWVSRKKYDAQNAVLSLV